MPNASKVKSKADSSKQPALFRWAWVWGLGLVAATLLCHYAGWRDAARAFFVVGVVVLTIAEIDSRYFVTRKGKPTENHELEPEEFYIRYPEPTESGWLNYAVIPSKTIYVEEVCYGGPPTDISTFEYTLKGDRVFARLVDLREEDFKSTHYEVVNGQILEADIRSRKPYDTTDDHIAMLKRDVTWTEVTGSLRYFILSQHDYGASFFTRERERLSEGFSKLNEKASQLGAQRGRSGSFKAKDEQNATAIRALQQSESLDRFGISFKELQNHEHIIQTLDRLISGSDVNGD